MSLCQFIIKAQLKAFKLTFKLVFIDTSVTGEEGEEKRGSRIELLSQLKT
jgi:hypothetical protein